jgi:uncharacterized membrane protein YqhA
MNPNQHGKETADRIERSMLANLIFGSRWLQLPLYLGLIVAQGVYVMKFLRELSTSRRSC